MDEALRDILTIAATLTVVAIIAAFTWKAISKPRLRLVYDEQERRWTATPRDVVQYALSIPFLISLWGLFFALLLILIPDYEAEKLIFVPTGFVIALRVLAHIWREPAVEFAKMVPIVVVTSALVLVQLPELDELAALVDRLDELEGDLDTTLSWAMAVGIDFIATAVWFFFGVRHRAPNGANVPGIPWREYPAAWWMRRGVHDSPFGPVSLTDVPKGADETTAEAASDDSGATPVAVEPVGHGVSDVPVEGDGPAKGDGPTEGDEPVQDDGAGHGSGAVLSRDEPTSDANPSSGLIADDPPQDGAPPAAR